MCEIASRKGKKTTKKIIKGVFLVSRAPAYIFVGEKQTKSYVVEKCPGDRREGGDGVPEKPWSLWITKNH